MKSQTKMTITTFGAAGAVAFIVGLGGISPSQVVPTPAAPTHASSSVAPATPNVSANGVHKAVLTTCISGLNC
ncbi:hypothetical protein [Mycobacterium florentinum]|uniref:hypothetical protein n=1 Tax=Mycobacterium florentinum TaxID=292462 RepID=UPI00111C0EE1|nr:hypothetical protein [Mycobacterium florentinum]MCV7413198.1 hypothetical protein [Mycobacterium florentinum]BBX76722.1 hypothetical protein MFLOJ_05090 [Mycobacterium florentinum]